MKLALLLLSGGLVNRGAEHSMLLLAEDLTQLGHQVTVFQAGPPATNVPYRVHQIKLPIAPSSHKPTSLLGKVMERVYLNQRGLLTLLFSLKVIPHLNHYDAAIPTDGFWQVLAAKLTGKPIVTVGLAGIGWTDRDTLKLQPDVFVALSQTAANWAKRINPKVTVRNIPLQVDIKTFFQAKPMPLHLHPPVILTVAALTAYKRIDLVIQAVAKIPHATLVIAGQGEEKPALQTLAEKSLPGRYRFVTVQFNELASLYRSADVFTLASESQEAFGQVLVEAMAAGLPIVTTDDPIRREIVGELGNFVNPTDIPQYAKALSTAIRLPKPVGYPHLKRYDRLSVATQYQELLLRL